MFTPFYFKFLLSMMAFFCVSLTIISRLEKRMVWPYSDLLPHPPFPLPYGYAEPRVAQAMAAGFKLLGWSRDLKGDAYKVAYAMVISPDRSTLAVIGEGNILNLRLACTWLHTPTNDGRSFYSTDHQAGVQLDLSRDWINQLCPKASLTDLLARHQQWIREQGVIPRCFRETREIEEFREIRRAHYQAMQRAGLIQYTDASAARFQFTMSGAARTACTGYFLGLARGLTMGRFPKNA